MGIYTDIGGSLMKVIDSSDTLDGKALASVFVGPETLSGNQIAFGAVFTDGSQGIFVATAAATPVPEPGTWLLMGTGLVGMAFYGWRKRRIGRRNAIFALPQP